MPSTANERLTLDTPVQFVRGVGPKRAAALLRLGIVTVGDLVEYYPFRHEEHHRCTIVDLEPGMIGTVIGRITAFRARRHARGPAAQATVTDNTGRCSVIWFNAAYVLDQLRRDAVVELTGKVGEYGGLPQFINPSFRIVPPDAAPISGRAVFTLDPVYPATAELGSRAIARLIGSLLPDALPQVLEWYPEAHCVARRLPPRRTCVERMHRPTTRADVEIARRRLAYDELLAMQTAVQVTRRERQAARGATPLKRTPEIDARIRKRLPFELTAAQDRAVRDITSDLARDRPMHRLLQGDVGCGKTAVALYAALVAVANRRQVALLAPTEILAEQHYASVARLLAGSQVRSALWTGGNAGRRREELQSALQAGQLDLVVGTQALLEPDVRFARLGLVIVDEQHRFGVRQRAALRKKGDSPHYLLMSATPIPRTLAMTLYGDLDISTIDALPPGRSPVRTRVLGPSDADHAWKFIRSRVLAGEQAFVVYPLVEESDASQLKAAAAEAQRLARGELRGLRVALLHGRMKPTDKDAVMRDFAERRADVLVATTVVEVGIDVPNATVIAIMHAERYGLAQLHQMRGRVGRGGRPGYCYLLRTDVASQPSEPDQSERVVPLFKLRPSKDESKAKSVAADASPADRLAVLERTTDGFAIAEADLRFRGPGELLGTRQHGLPELHVVDFERDMDLLRLAQRDAAELLAGGGWESPDWLEFRRAVQRRFAPSQRVHATDSQRSSTASESGAVGSNTRPR